jgi:hypothetical protein
MSVKVEAQNSTGEGIGLAAFYNLIFASRGFALAPHHYPIVAGLEDDRIENLLYLGPPGTGKSSLLCTVYPAYRLGKHPADTILSVSASMGLPATFMQAVMQIIQHNKVYRKLFPDVQPAQQLGWSLQRGLFVTGHHPEDENASYMSCGIASKALTGLHCRTMILDDLHDNENAGRPELRASVKTVYYNTLMGRADPRGCRRIAAGRWWAPDDLYQELIANGDWVVLELPAARPGNTRLWYDVYVPKGITCVYTERCEKVENKSIAGNPQLMAYDKYRYYYAAIDTTKQGFYWPDSPSKRKEYATIERRQPRIAAINYRGDMSGGQDSVFQPSDFATYLPPPDLHLGIAHNPVRIWCDSLKGVIEDAWDTALGQVQSESKTANLTGLLVPCNQYHRNEDPNLLGKCDFHYDVYLLDLMVADIDFGKLLTVFKTRYGLWHPRRVNVEEKQSGVSLIQLMRNAHIPVHPIKVVEGKLERAVNPVLMDQMPVGGGAASVQGWVKMGRVHVPAGAAWVEPFLEKICEYRGGSRNTDEFDALVHLVTRAILSSRKTARIGASSDANLALSADPRAQTLSSFGQLAAQQENPFGEGIVNPFEGMCGAPCGWFSLSNNQEWCGFHERATIAFDGCTHWALPGSSRIAQVKEQRRGSF